MTDYRPEITIKYPGELHGDEKVRVIDQRPMEGGIETDRKFLVTAESATGEIQNLVRREPGELGPIYPKTDVGRLIIENYQMLEQVGLPVPKMGYSEERGRTVVWAENVTARGGSLYGKSTLSRTGKGRVTESDWKYWEILDLQWDEIFDEKIPEFVDKASQLGVLLPPDDAFEIFIKPDGSWEFIILDVTFAQKYGSPEATISLGTYRGKRVREINAQSQRQTEDHLRQIYNAIYRDIQRVDPERFETLKASNDAKKYPWRQQSVTEESRGSQVISEDDLSNPERRRELIDKMDIIFQMTEAKSRAMGKLAVRFESDLRETAIGGSETLPPEIKEDVAKGEAGLLVTRYFDFWKHITNDRAAQMLVEQFGNSLFSGLQVHDAIGAVMESDVIREGMLLIQDIHKAKAFRRSIVEGVQGDRLLENFDQDIRDIEQEIVKAITKVITNYYREGMDVELKMKGGALQSLEALGEYLETHHANEEFIDLEPSRIAMQSVEFLQGSRLNRKLDGDVSPKQLRQLAAMYHQRSQDKLMGWILGTDLSWSKARQNLRQQ